MLRSTALSICLWPLWSFRPETKPAVEPELQVLTKAVANLTSSAAAGPSARLSALSSLQSALEISISEPTDHLSEETKTLFEEVVHVIQDSLLGDLDASHAKDQQSLNKAAERVEQINNEFRTILGQGGSLGGLREVAEESRALLLEQQADRDAKEGVRSEKERTLNLLMSMHKCTPEVQSVEAWRQFHSDMSNFVAAFPGADADFANADEEHSIAVTRADATLVQRDTQLCDWHEGLLRECSRFTEELADAKGEFDVELETAQANVVTHNNIHKKGTNVLASLLSLLGTEPSSTADTGEDKYHLIVPVIPEDVPCDRDEPRAEGWDQSSCPSEVETPAPTPAPITYVDGCASILNVSGIPTSMEGQSDMNGIYKRVYGEACERTEEQVGRCGTILGHPVYEGPYVTKPYQGTLKLFYATWNEPAISWARGSRWEIATHMKKGWTTVWLTHDDPCPTARNGGYWHNSKHEGDLVWNPKIEELPE